MKILKDNEGFLTVLIEDLKEIKEEFKNDFEVGKIYQYSKEEFEKRFEGKLEGEKKSRKPASN